jgi:hypothetical protein
MSQRGSHQTPEQAERLGIPVRERTGLGSDHLENSMDPLLVP